MALIENDFRLLKKTGEAWLRAQLCIVCISVLWGKRLCSPKPFLLKRANGQRKENQGRVKGTHAEVHFSSPSSEPDESGHCPSAINMQMEKNGP